MKDRVEEGERSEEVEKENERGAYDFSLLSCRRLPLKTRMKKIQERLDAYEKQDIDAVRRQLAINIEFEMKLMAIPRIADLAPLLQADVTEEVEKKIDRMDVARLMEQLEEKDQHAICCRHFHQSSFPLMKTVLYDMKAYNTSAQPLTLFGEPVTYNIAKDIAATTTRRNRRFAHSNLPKIEQTQVLAQSAVLGLYEIRKKQQGWEEGQTLLYNYE